jgi:hypothetical protein
MEADDDYVNQITEQGNLNKQESSETQEEGKQEDS